MGISISEIEMPIFVFCNFRFHANAEIQFLHMLKSNGKRTWPYSLPCSCCREYLALAAIAAFHLNTYQAGTLLLHKSPLAVHPGCRNDHAVRPPVR